MSLLPQQIQPQTVPFGYVDGGGRVFVDINWYLFLYNIANKVLGAGSLPVTLTDDDGGDSLQDKKQIVNTQLLQFDDAGDLLQNQKQIINSQLLQIDAAEVSQDNKQIINSQLLQIDSAEMLQDNKQIINSQLLQLDADVYASMQSMANALMLALDAVPQDPISQSSLLKVGSLSVNGGATFLTTATALTNGAGVAAGTIFTAPVAGNPTKWIGINDNGTIRYIPAW